MRDSDLADAIEVELVCIIEPFENPWAVPVEFGRVSLRLPMHKRASQSPLTKAR